MMLNPTLVTSVALWLLPSVVLAQAPAPRLSPAEATVLRDKFTRFLRDDTALVLAADKDGKEIERAERARLRAEEEFALEWQRQQRKGNLLASPADLRQIFFNCFPVRPGSAATGSWRESSVEFAGVDEKHSYGVLLPKGLRVDTPARAVLLIPGTASAAGGDWTPASAHFAATWAGSPLLADSVFHGVTVPAKWQLDVAPDPRIDGADEIDATRTRLLLGTFGETLNVCSVDRSRVFLDCGRGACGFGLRFATLFPDRFAGVVLRAPTAVDALRLGSLRHVPVLLLRTADSALVVDALFARLQKDAPGMATVLEANDAYPHPAMAAAIGEWLGKQRRSMVPMQVTIEPNTDDNNRAYWVDIEAGNTIAAGLADRVPRVDLPRIEAVADRSTNTITVTCTGVERFALQLNDQLLDLDQPFVVVVNGREFREKRTRSFQQLRDGLVGRSDWEYLFPVAFSTSVPK